MASLRLRILLLGSGGREHALAWHLSHSERVDVIFVAPGNSGTQHQAVKTCNAAADFQEGKNDKVLSFCKKNDVNLIIPTQELHLVNGIVDFFRKANIRCFGPTKLAARLEGSKAFAKSFMTRYGIPTANQVTFESLIEAKSWMIDHFARSGRRIVIKASGINFGKGVFVVDTLEQALTVLDALVLQENLGIFVQIGPVIVEEYLEGVEFSTAALTDGSLLTMLPPFRDYKRLCGFDRGPNTGGMGTMCPTLRCPPEGLKQIEEKFFRPTLDGMRKEGCSYSGFLCMDFIWTAAGPKGIEYDCRFGDPETQALIPLIQTRVDVAEMAWPLAGGPSNDYISYPSGRFCVAVVLISDGYPDSSQTGQSIEISAFTEEGEGIYIFHGGMTESDGLLKVARGRVATVCSVGNSLQEARQRAYTGVISVKFKGMAYRLDIGDEMSTSWAGN
ncbi:phosphoribosylformylglycinamidine cyclo-ligase [Colletotrichum incanum]|uniref:phosphoribosylamine--glycine ligase n=1 Tax=Colletotrichum incanum TaxID=1573173 RepID=A0A162P960_COLIC|nr:phosphoribosylformylglycinamidine cyclo-ligase [Colletotrichum incanum]